MEEHSQRIVASSCSLCFKFNAEFYSPFAQRDNYIFPHNSEAVFALFVVALSLMTYRWPCFSEMKLVHSFFSGPSLNHQLSMQHSSGVHWVTGLRVWRSRDRGKPALTGSTGSLSSHRKLSSNKPSARHRRELKDQICCCFAVPPPQQDKTPVLGAVGLQTMEDNHLPHHSTW